MLYCHLLKLISITIEGDHPTETSQSRVTMIYIQIRTLLRVKADANEIGCQDNRHKQTTQPDWGA